MPLAWRVELAPLAQGLLVVHLVGAEAAAPSGTSTSGHGRIDVRDLRLRIPAAAVGALDPRLQSVALGGNVAVDAPSFAASGQDASGTIDVRWANARLVAANTVVDLGTVSLAVAPAGNHAAGTLRNVGGDVAVDGTLTGETGALEAVLTLRPTTTTPDRLRTMLPLLGVPDGAGGARVTWRSDR
jgi:hypothetical protein